MNRFATPGRLSIMKRVFAVFGGSLATGLLLHGALPPIGWWPLGWVAFVPLLLAINGTRFLVGFLGGLGAIGVTAWLGIQGVGFQHLSYEGSPAWIVVGCALFGFALAIVAGLAAESKLARPWRLAAVAVLLEACLLIYLPASVALTQSRVPAMLTIASIGGVWAIAYAVWFVNLVFAQQIAKGRLGRVAVAFGIGWFVLGIYPGTRIISTRGVENILLVQTTTTDLKRLNELNGTIPNTLAIWPEFAGMEAAPAGDTAELTSYSKTATPFITSYQSREKPLPYNVAALFSDGIESKPYQKRKLFGGETSMHLAGNSPVMVPWEDTNVGLNICFDSCYPAIMRETVALGADIIALPTIDPPSPHHWIAAMHAAFTPIRAAELGVPIARADGGAYSMIADASGRILLELPPGESSAMAMVPKATVPTLYRRVGDWALFACGAAIFAPAIFGLRRRRRAAGGTSEAA